MSTATAGLVDPLFQENAREDLLESLKACQNDDARYELLLQTIQNPALYDALLDAYEEF